MLVEEEGVMQGSDTFRYRLIAQDILSVRISMRYSWTKTGTHIDKPLDALLDHPHGRVESC